MFELLVGHFIANVFPSCGHDFIQFIFLCFFFHRAVFSAIFSLTVLPALSLLLLTFYLYVLSMVNKD